MIELGERTPPSKDSEDEEHMTTKECQDDEKEGLSSKEASSRWIEAIETGLSRERRVPATLRSDTYRLVLPMIIVGFVFIIMGASGIRKHHEIETVVVGSVVLMLCFLNVLLEYRRDECERTHVPNLLRRHILSRGSNSSRKQYHHHEGNFVACFRDKVWTWISPSLLVRGDIVALKADQYEICTFASSLKKLNSSTTKTSRYEQYIMIDTPALKIVESSIQSSFSSKRSSTHFRSQLDIMFRFQAIFAPCASIIAFLVCLIEWLAKDQETNWEEILLIRPLRVTLCSFPVFVPFMILLAEVICSSTLLSKLTNQKNVLTECLRRILVFFGGSSESIQLPFSRRVLDAIDRIGSVTAMCCVDPEVVCESEPLIEEMCVQKEDDEMSGRVILDLHRDMNSRSGIRFEDTQWTRHLASLKPLGLCCFLNSQRTIDSLSSSSLEDMRLREFILRTNLSFRFFDTCKIYTYIHTGTRGVRSSS